jgi:hypothetical protein
VSDFEDVAFAAVDSDNKNIGCKYVTFCTGYFRNILALLVGNVVCISVIKKAKTRVLTLYLANLTQ